jgi:diguanylate cyclase (GGDEF)-like protein/PAS domain S-box-containing protein
MNAGGSALDPERLTSRRAPSPVRLASTAVTMVVVGLSVSGLFGAIFSYRADEQTQQAAQISDAFEDARVAIAAEQSAERNYRIDPGNGPRVQHGKAADNLVKSLKQALHLGDTNEESLIGAILAEQKDYLAGVNATFAAIDAGDLSLANKIDADQVNPFIEAIEAQVLNGARNHRSESTQQLQELARFQTRVIIAVPATFIMGMSFALFFWLRIRRYRVEAELGLVRETNAIRDSERRYRALIQNASDIVLVCSNEGVITYQSPTNQVSWRYSPNELVGHTLRELVHSDDLAVVDDLFARLPPESGSTGNAEVRFRNSEDQWLHVDLILTNLLRDSSIRGFVATARDITERKSFEGQLTHQAFHDPLTCLPNRALFRRRLDQALHRTSMTPHIVGILFIDLDNFKLINDSLGHHVGDGLLIEVAARLSKCMSGSSIVARLGGDEFVVLLDRLADESEAVALADEVSRRFDQPFFLEHQTFHVTASVGITCGIAGHASAEHMLRDADVAMYRAKSSGKARHVVFDMAMQIDALTRLDLESDLHRAVANSEFYLHYQPIVSLATEQMTGVEALVRWQHPVRGLVPPAAFISIAEDTGLIVPLGRWILNEACRHVALWQKLYPAQPPLTLSVNLSPRQFLHAGLLEDVKQVLGENDFPASCLFLEITEGVIMRDVEASVHTLTQLKELGVKIAIDDFGTGYSSLAYLKRLPLDVLKIDRSFVRGVGQDSEDVAIVHAVIAMAKSLRLSITAEGIETAQQASLLHNWSCERGQGFHFARPLCPGDLEMLLKFQRLIVPDPMAA